MAVLHIDNLGVQLEGLHMVDHYIVNFMVCLSIQFMLPESNFEAGLL